MPFLSVSEETAEALNLLRLEGESDDLLLERIVEYARCYMIIQGAEDVDEASTRALKDLPSMEAED